MLLRNMGIIGETYNEDPSRSEVKLLMNIDDLAMGLIDEEFF